MNLNGSSASKPSLSHHLSYPEGKAGRCSKSFCCLTVSVEPQCLRKPKQTETQAQNDRLEPLVDLQAINAVTIRISGVLRSCSPRMCLTWGCRGISLFSLGVHLVEVWKLSLGRILQVCPHASLSPQLFLLLSDPCSLCSPTCWTLLLMADSSEAGIYFWEQLE